MTQATATGGGEIGRLSKLVENPKQESMEEVEFTDLKAEG